MNKIIGVVIDGKHTGKVEPVVAERIVRETPKMYKIMDGSHIAFGKLYLNKTDCGIVYKDTGTSYFRFRAYDIVREGESVEGTTERLIGMVTSQMKAHLEQRIILISNWIDVANNLVEYTKE